MMKISTETPAAPVRRKSCDKVIVAVKAEKVIAKAALAWALTHVVRPGDCVTLLAVFFQERTGMNWIVVFSARLEPSLIGLIALGNDFFFFFIVCIVIFYLTATERRRFWGFPRLKGDCQASESSKLPDRISQISESCSQMVLQFHDQIDVSGSAYSLLFNFGNVE